MYVFKTPKARRAALEPTSVVVPPAQAAADRQYQDVDVAIVMESTYPYLKGGVSAVVHDIVTHNPDLTYGIIHITWDADAPHEDLYGMPENVVWVRPVYLSMQEHRHDFMAATSKDLGMTSQQRRVLADRLFDALYALSERREVEPLWQLIDEGFNERTRSFPLWALLGTREFMEALSVRMPQLDLSLANSFWTLRNFLSLAFAILGETMPKARVYHAHTTGYAALLGAAAARDHGTSFLLTEHNLYVRDTVNTLLDRNMALSITSEDYRTFDVTAEQRAWMAWWIEMGHFCYPSATLITYLYPTAITEAARLGTDIDKAVVVPNAMVIEEFEQKYSARLAAQELLAQNADTHTWKLVYIARVVPIKGMLDLLSSIDLLRRDGFPNVHLDVLGPTEHVPEYFEACLAKIESLGLRDHVTIHGTVNVRDMLDQFDLLVLPSYNEGQPIVVLEAMAAGIPTVGTSVGGMSQLIGEDLHTRDGRTVGSCGVLTTAGDIQQMADGIRAVIRDGDLYARYAANARTRVQEFFQMHEIMSSYNEIYRTVGDISDLRGLDSAAFEEAARSAL
ncbi:GT4 family glycosyltransferase PelF [Arthrobacter agilis]|uniref:GT4 family glycosyltransferase PelF n=1 Tax=Arthrobacter agilis TaxID=37921 RepID=UPI00236602CA|nr:GT4 family glycosyltransferase PelF [Arthrobacter agilis]WDF33584.1 GT4 family glycosyltransferase PelF [Arthrobacter agilis]